MQASLQLPLLKQQLQASLQLLPFNNTIHLTGTSSVCFLRSTPR